MFIRDLFSTLPSASANSDHQLETISRNQKFSVLERFQAINEKKVLLNVIERRNES